MRNLRKIAVTATLMSIIVLQACYTTKTAGNSGKVPPGQAKKATGSKSAKPFAPGQQKP